MKAVKKPVWERDSPWKSSWIEPSILCWASGHGLGARIPSCYKAHLALTFYFTNVIPFWRDWRSLVVFHDRCEKTNQKMHVTQNMWNRRVLFRQDRFTVALIFIAIYFSIWAAHWFTSMLCLCLWPFAKIKHRLLFTSQTRKTFTCKHTIV